MIGWIKCFWGCDWSKENDIIDSCQVLSRNVSEILNDLDQRLSFLCVFSRLGASISASRHKIPNKNMILKESLWDQGNKNSQDVILMVLLRVASSSVEKTVILMLY